MLPSLPRRRSPLERTGSRLFLLSWTAAVLLLASGLLRAQEPMPMEYETSPALAETDHVIDFWRAAQGLPHNRVNAVLQTRDGYLWVGTSAGLARFDGLVFTPATDESVPELKGAIITSLLEDREGGLWAGTQGRGLFHLHNGRVMNLTTAHGLSDDAVTSLAEDRDGFIWIGTQSGLNRWDRRAVTIFSDEGVRSNATILALHAGRSGSLWITTRRGVFSLKSGQLVPFQHGTSLEDRNSEFLGVYEDRSGNLWGFSTTFLLNLTQGRRFNYFRSLELASSRAWTMCEQTDGTFWIGTSGRGLFRFNGERFEVAGAREGLDQNDVRALCADTSGNVWVGTGGNGLARLRTRRFRFIGANEGLQSQAVSSIALDPSGKLWVGTMDSGLYQWDGRRMHPSAGGSALDRVSQIQSLCVDRAGALWVGTWGAGLWRITQTNQQRFGTSEGLGDDTILALATDPRNDAIWVGTREGTLHRVRQRRVETFPLEGGPTPQAISALLVDTDGTLLAGLDYGGLVSWDGKSFRNLDVPPELEAYPVRCLIRDWKDRLWVGTGGGGAFCRYNDEWRRLSVAQGLGSDVINQVSQDETGDFWFGTDENLFKVRASEMETFLSRGRETISWVAAVPEESMGVLRAPLGWPSVVTSSNGVSWLAVSTGILPRDRENRIIAEPPPPVIIESVLVDGRPLRSSEGAVLQLGPRARSLDFVFTAISFNSPQKIRFRHKLENFDRDWVDTGVARRAHYGPLPPGNYRFRVIAAGSNGAWNETGAFQEFVVAPSLWRSWWFLSFSGIASVGMIWAAARFISTRRLHARLRIARQEHAMERERARIARDMHDEIGSKLTRISFLSEVARQPAPAAGAAPIEAIATTSRELLQSLDEIVWAVNPGNDSLEQLAGYLEDYAREYFQSMNMDCQIHVPAELPRVPFSAEARHNVFLAFKEALNNALKHAQATGVEITMTLQDEIFEVRVQDNGQGFLAGADPKREQNGLGNMRARMRAMGGFCRIESAPGRGTAVCLRFPLEPLDLRDF